MVVGRRAGRVRRPFGCHSTGAASRDHLILCLAANPAVDKFFSVRELSSGSIHRPENFVQVAGGKGLNVARAAHALGADVTAVAIVGGHSGEWIEDALADEGIPARFAHSSHETRACLSIAAGNVAGLTEFYEDPGPVDADVWSAFVTHVTDELEGAEWMTITGSLPPGAPDDGYATLVEAARARHISTILDSRGDGLRRTLPAGPDLVKINRHEAEEVLGAPIDGQDAAAGAARALLELSGGRCAIVTGGPDGATAVDANGTRHVGLDVLNPYPVGSGDAFLAGLVTAMSEGAALEEALALATGAAVANAAVPGPGRFDATAARELAARVRIVRGRE